MSFSSIYSFFFFFNKTHISLALTNIAPHSLTFAFNKNNDKARIFFFFPTVTILLFLGNVELGKRKSTKAQLLQQFLNI